MKWLYALLAIALASSAHAGGRGGHNTTFDPSSYGGSWSCFRTAASGTCGGATAQYFDATCDGVANDATALATWNSAGNPKLYIPPGSRCQTSTGFLTAGIVWAYGAAIITDVNIGGQLSATSNPFQAFVQTWAPGDTSLTLVTIGDASSVPVGRWIIADCVSLQDFGYPPNWQVFSFHIVTAVVGAVVSIAPPLANTCKSTYPQPSTALLAGPASLHVIDANWNNNLQIFGLEIKQDTGQTNASGKNIILTDVRFTGSNSTSAINPTAVKSIWCFFCNLGNQVEVDKQVDFAGFYQSIAGQIEIQSGSLNTLLLDHVSTPTLNGLAGNATITASAFTSETKIGPLGFGHGKTLSVDGSTITVPNQACNEIPTAQLTFSSGTFSQALVSGNVANVYSTFVPGQKYYFGYHNCGRCTPLTTFTITDMRQDATNVYVDTDIVGSIPTPTCNNGGTFDTYTAYPASSITQKFSGPGDLTQLAPP